jgi:levansucrase
MTERWREAAPAAWTRAQAAGIARSEETVKPIIYPSSEKVSSDVHIWDTWLLRDPDGSIANVNGYRVIFSLTAPSDLLPGKRHDTASIRYFYSTDGRNWTDGGHVFAGSEPFGSRQWAGCAMYDPDGAGGDVSLYYTAAGERDEAELSYGQRIALATGGTLRADGDLVIEGPWNHEILLDPDGEYYETEEQSREMIYTFRDPWFFRDPTDGETYLLFEANVPVPEGSDLCDGDAEQQGFNGCVGVARSPTDDPTRFELRPPLLHGVGVNQELERPHIVVRDGRYYLFISSHMHTFAPGLDGVDAMYGFVADDFRGDYEPLNGSGLVLTNPGNASFQAYSWLAFEHEEEILVTSFFNFYDFNRPSLDDIALLPEEEQFRRFGGTLAPTVRLGLDAAAKRTKVLGTLDSGHIPLPSEPLPELERESADAGGRRSRYRRSVDR